MLSAIRDFFERQVREPVRRGDGEHALQVATAALFAEMMRIDRDVQPEEQAALTRALEQKFGLDPAQSRTLMELAEQEARQATDYFQFTSLINQHFDAAQKVRLVELMFSIAYADGRLSDHEHHLMRKIGELLHVPIGDYAAAKTRARQAAGLE